MMRFPSSLFAAAASPPDGPGGAHYFRQLADGIAAFAVNAIGGLGGNASFLQRRAVGGITWAELLTSTLFIGLILLVNSVILKRLRRQILARETGRDPKSWRVLNVEAVGRPLFLAVWIYGVYFAAAPLIVHLQGAGGRVHPARLLFDKLFDFGLFVAIFWLLFRFIRVFEVRMELWAARTKGALDDLLVPLFAKSLRISVPVIAVIFALPLLNLPPEFGAIIQKGSSILIIGTVAWILCQAVFLGEKVVLSRYDLQQADNLRARQVYTQVVVLKKTSLFIIGIFTIASVLMLFEEVRRLGTSILASAGVVGIIFGFAAQRTIANLFAGFQIAMTQPIRIDDVVIVEGEWGRIEEITLTYVIVRIWDLRRLVLPLNYFIERPFQNWTRVSADILGTVFLYTDYTIPVEEIRGELKRIVEKSPDWDGKVCGLQVTDAKEHTLELRALASAADASKAWDLRCEIREKLITFIQKNHPQSLPRVRAEMESSNPPSKTSPAGIG